MTVMDSPDRPPSSSAPPDDGSAVVADRPAGPEAGAPAAVEVAEGKTERIAVMRHSLAELQRQLLDAQQRIAAELQGRAEDADRFEELEARVQTHEVKAREDAARIAELGAEAADVRARLESASKTGEELRRELAARDARIEESHTKHRELTEQLETHVSSLRDTKSLLAARDAELATRLAERDADQATRTRLEHELEASVGKHRELTEQLETHATSLREAKALLADRDATLATRTAERDAQQETRTRLEGELEEARRALDAGRARAQELAKQLTSFGTEMLEAVVTGDPRGAPPARSAAVPPSAPKPPDLPGTRPPRLPTGPHADPVEDAQVIEAKPVAAVEPSKVPARSRTGASILVLGGIAVGVVVSLAVGELGGSTTTTATQPRDVAGEPLAASPVASAVGGDQPTVPAADASASPEDAWNASTSGAAPSADAQRTGIIVLPAEADGHRVFVDGRRFEPKNGRVEVPCGKHDVRIGGRGEPRMLDVACDGETELREPPPAR